MRKRTFFIMILAMIAGVVPAALLAIHRETQAFQALPTVAVLPSLTSTSTTTQTLTPSHTPTPTITNTPSHTPTTTATLTPTTTPTLSTRVVEINAIMPDVYVPPSLTPFPPGTNLLPAPPQPEEPLPDATNAPPPYEGWYSFESDHPLVQYAPTYWERRLAHDASRGQYHRATNSQETMRFVFEGEGLRIRYVAARNMGIFDVIVDGVVIDTVDAYAPELNFPGTQVYFVGSGMHTLILRNAQRKNNASDGYVIGLDAIQVYRGSANTLILPPPAITHTPTPEPQPAAAIALVAGPPTAMPTITPNAPAELTFSVVIAYDENGNRAVDPAEGVRGISVRLVEVGTNRVISQAFTDVQGFAELEITTSVQARVVVPYFGKVWEVSQRRSGGQASFTLLLEPGNQPGLIP